MSLSRRTLCWFNYFIHPPTGWHFNGFTAKTPRWWYRDWDLLLRWFQFAPLFVWCWCCLCRPLVDTVSPRKRRNWIKSRAIDWKRLLIVTKSLNTHLTYTGGTFAKHVVMLTNSPRRHPPHEEVEERRANHQFHFYFYSEPFIPFHSFITVLALFYY